MGRVDGSSTRLVETRARQHVDGQWKPVTRQLGPSTRVVETGLKCCYCCWHLAFFCIYVCVIYISFCFVFISFFVFFSSFVFSWLLIIVSHQMVSLMGPWNICQPALILLYSFVVWIVYKYHGRNKDACFNCLLAVQLPNSSRQHLVNTCEYDKMMMRGNGRCHRRWRIQFVQRISARRLKLMLRK